MATTSKRISQLKLFEKAQHDSLWQSCVVPANFNDLDVPEYPDTYKVPMSSLFLSIRKASFDGSVVFKNEVNFQNVPIVFGNPLEKNQSNSFILKGTTVGNSVYLNRDSTSEKYLQIQVGSSWFFKLFVIGVSSRQLSNSTSVEFNGLIRNSGLGEVTFVGTPSKIIHSRDNINTDAIIEADNRVGYKTIQVKVFGGTDTADTYNWTARLDIVQV